MNYHDTFIRVAPDCPAETGIVPTPRGGKKTIAVHEYEILSGSPYTYTQEDVQLSVHARREGISERELASRRDEIRAAYFSKSRACLRSSPLPKRYGWGIHFDTEGKAAIYPIDGEEYRRHARDESLQQLPAMRSRRAR